MWLIALVYMATLAMSAANNKAHLQRNVLHILIAVVANVINYELQVCEEISRGCSEPVPSCEHFLASIQHHVSRVPLKSEVLHSSAP